MQERMKNLLFALHPELCTKDNFQKTLQDETTRFRSDQLKGMISQVQELVVDNMTEEEVINDMFQGIISKGRILVGMAYFQMAYVFKDIKVSPQSFQKSIQRVYNVMKGYLEPQIQYYGGWDELVTQVVTQQRIPEKEMIKDFTEMEPKPVKKYYQVLTRSYQKL